jgi:hypothetical protein
VGASLATQAFAHWSHLSDRAFRVLLRMSLVALDKPKDGSPAAVYFAGRELLAMSLRSDGGSSRTRYRTVAKAIAELTEVGVIEHLATGWAGQNAVYRLNLSRTNPITESPGMGGSSAHPMDGPYAHPMGVPDAREWMGVEHTPRNQEEPIEELGEEKSEVDLTTTSHPSRAIGNVTQLFGTRRSREVLAEAQANVAARKAAHQARLAEEA